MRTSASAAQLLIWHVGIGSIIFGSENHAAEDLTRHVRQNLSVLFQGAYVIDVFQNNGLVNLVHQSHVVDC